MYINSEMPGIPPMAVRRRASAWSRSDGMWLTRSVSDPRTTNRSEGSVSVSRESRVGSEETCRESESTSRGEPSSPQIPTFGSTRLVHPSSRIAARSVGIGTDAHAPAPPVFLARHPATNLDQADVPGEGDGLQHRATPGGRPERMRPVARSQLCAGEQGRGGQAVPQVRQAGRGRRQAQGRGHGRATSRRRRVSPTASSP